MKNKIYRMVEDKAFFEQFIKEGAPWTSPADEELPWEQLRSLFTTWCIHYDIDADTDVCDATLIRMYVLMQSEMPRKEFENFFLAHIV